MSMLIQRAVIARKVLASQGCFTLMMMRFRTKHAMARTKRVNAYVRNALARTLVGTT